jgi:hypothetical protein
MNTIIGKTYYSFYPKMTRAREVAFDYPGPIKADEKKIQGKEVSVSHEQTRATLSHPGVVLL